jgi:hypothetical protein
VNKWLILGLIVLIAFSAGLVKKGAITPGPFPIDAENYMNDNNPATAMNFNDNNRRGSHYDFGELFYPDQVFVDSLYIKYDAPLCVNNWKITDPGTDPASAKYGVIVQCYDGFNWNWCGPKVGENPLFSVLRDTDDAGNYYVPDKYASIIRRQPKLDTTIQINKKLWGIRIQLFCAPRGDEPVMMQEFHINRCVDNWQPEAKKQPKGVEFMQTSQCGNSRVAIGTYELPFGDLNNDGIVNEDETRLAVMKYLTGAYTREQLGSVINNWAKETEIPPVRP